jgi:hypothetical protein
VDVLTAAHGAFGPAAECALGVARIEAATAGERAVPTVVEIPIRLSPPLEPARQGDV